MKLNPFLCTFLFATLLLFVSCEKDTGNEDADSISSAPRTESIGEGMLETDLLKAVRRATARFHSTTLAMAAGYQRDNHCVSVPGLGGMGYHWVNMQLVDPVFDPLQPEVLLYASGPGGKLRLVAVEYIVIKANQPWPTFDNHPFDNMGTPVPAPHWSLHVWLHENNPSGIFTPFNPNITCP